MERDQLLTVLTSKGTASSADNFTDIPFNVEITLVIGSNTAGVMISTASVDVKAPNTGTIGQAGCPLILLCLANWLIISASSILKPFRTSEAGLFPMPKVIAMGVFSAKLYCAAH